MKNIIKVENLNKTFRQEIKKNGLKDKFMAYLKPEYKDFEAVSNISFTVEE
jgi:ABC-type uncharacterized transport system ATPase subunit